MQVAVPTVFRLFGANVAEAHFRDIGADAFARAVWQTFGYSNRLIRTRQNATDRPTPPPLSWCPPLWAPCVVKDLDGREIVWDDIPPWAQQFAPGIVGKRGPNGTDAASQGLAQAVRSPAPPGHDAHCLLLLVPQTKILLVVWLVMQGGGGPTLTIENVVASSDFCGAWLIDSNYPAVRMFVFILLTHTIELTM